MRTLRASRCPELRQASVSFESYGRLDDYSSDATRMSTNNSVHQKSWHVYLNYYLAMPATTSLFVDHFTKHPSEGTSSGNFTPVVGPVN